VTQPVTLLEGKYEILDKIREGGMGSIYRVRHRLLDEVRVVKVMKPSVVADADLKRRFTEEARTATRLKHPNICTIHDFALDPDGMAYLVMEYIQGVSLAELLKMKGVPPLALTLEIAHQALLALGYLHRKGIVHRDVAPDNIMLAQDEEGAPLVKLIDLGIAKVADGPIDATATGVFLGKIKYASPEQYGSLPRGTRLDGRSDLYGFGIVLYELLTGVLPFEGNTVVELLRAHVFASPRPFSESDPDGRVPEELRGVVLKALEKNRDDRHATAEEFDREILGLRRKYVRPGETGQTRIFLRSVRPSTGIHLGAVTPSAQDRIDRQFGGKTPTPRTARSPDTGVTSAGEETEVAPSSAPIPAPAPRNVPLPPPVGVPTTPLPAPLRRRSLAWLWIAAGAVGAASAVVLLRSPARPPVLTSVAAAPTALVSTAIPSAAPALQPTLVPSLEPTAEPTAAPTTAPRPTPRATPPPRPTSTRAIPVVAVPPPTPAPAPPTPAPQPPRVVAALAPTEAPRPAVAAPTSRPAQTEQDRIRETIRRYETAQNTLDAELYASVFPGADRGRIESAFRDFVKQSVEFEVRRIELDPKGTAADVYGYEKRVAVPRAGSEQRISADRVLHMQKRGDAWVITAIR
jgi:eukaryotic-like serine/threonine-protein kinase